MTRVVDFLTSGALWAIQPDVLQTMLQIAQRENDLEAVLKERGEPLKNTYRVEDRDGVAVIHITGPLFPRANLFAEISGAMSVEMLARELAVADKNVDIHSAVLVFDTPGGHVTMINEFAHHIAAFSKPIVGYVVGTAASGGYWCAAACDKIVMDATAVVGSIGVVAAYQKDNDDTIEFVSSNAPDKLVDIETNSGKATVQALIDDMETVFVESVMNFRGMSREQVIGLRGGVVIGAKAIESGFADELGSLESVISQLQEENPMDLDTLKADHLDTYQAAVNVGVAQANAENESVTATAKDEAITAERDRIASITTCDEATDRSKMANHIAFDTAMTADDAKKMLASAPVDAKGNDFTSMDAEMDKHGNPVVNADGADDADKGSDAANLKMFNEVGAIK
ncbi:MAG: S49 family peptidase [Gammaproteobacteria bacterium]|nr:S49 family peptidase [Gammaproteobacteria bacterium]